MKRTVQLLFTTTLLIFSHFTIVAQNYLGVHSSNYAGVMALDNQPASFVDGRFKFDLNLGSANVGVWNNAKYFDTKDMPKWWKKSFTTDTSWIRPDSTFADRYVGDFYNYNDAGVKHVVFISTIKLTYSILRFTLSQPLLSVFLRNRV